MTSTNTLNVKIQLEVVRLASSIKEIVDKFRQLHDPLSESRKTVPRATEQLDKVSEQTEAAAQQMLDKIEKITERDQEVISDLKKIKENPSAGANLIDELINKMESSCNDAFMIMDTLQFQDITAQQMDHAASLMEEIEMKLIGIVGVLDGEQEQVSDSAGTISRKDRAFDPHADMFEAKTDQKDIDDMINDNRNDN